MRATAHCLVVADPADDALLYLVGCLRSPALGCCCCLLQAASTMSNVPLIVGVTVGAAAITMFAVKAAMSAKRRRGPRRTKEDRVRVAPAGTKVGWAAHRHSSSTSTQGAHTQYHVEKCPYPCLLRGFSCPGPFSSPVGCTHECVCVKFCCGLCLVASPCPLPCRRKGIDAAQTARPPPHRPGNTVTEASQPRHPQRVRSDDTSQSFLTLPCTAECNILNEACMLSLALQSPLCAVEPLGLSDHGFVKSPGGIRSPHAVPPALPPTHRDRTAASGDGACMLLLPSEPSHLMSSSGG